MKEGVHFMHLIKMKILFFLQVLHLMELPLHMVLPLMEVDLQLHMSTQPSSPHIVLLPLQQLLHQHTMLLLHLHIK